MNVYETGRIPSRPCAHIYLPGSDVPLCGPGRVQGHPRRIPYDPSLPHCSTCERKKQARERAERRVA